MTRIAIVIPAHDEERTIGRLLDALSGLAGEAQLAVVCNGCTDATAAVARGAAPWAEVVELATASKPAALSAGDRVVSVTPRLYLDADVILSANAVRRLAAALVVGDLAAVAPTPEYDTTGAGIIVRSHYRIWIALQSTSNAISGTGAMMISAAGRNRFGEWPDVIADDFFLDGLFEPQEKRRLPDVGVTIVLPRRFGGCVSRRARVHQGNYDVLRSGLRRSADRPGTGLAALLRSNPVMIVHLPGHVAVAVAARLLSAWRRWRGAQYQFYRDASSR